MFIKQISVFLENTPGRLAAYTKVLADHRIDMKAICIADTSDFGILRCIVDDPEAASKVLKDNGFAASVTEVLAVGLNNTPGGLDGAVEILKDAGVSIEYVYSFMKAVGNNAVIIFRVDKLEEALEALTSGGVAVLNMEEILK